MNCFKLRSTLIFCLSLLAAFSMAVQSASASEWPAKPITLVVGFGAGGGTDTIARTLAKGMGDYLGQKVAVINMPGASGSVAGMEVMKKPADGYTWFGCANNTGRWRALGYTDLTFSDFYSFSAATDAQGIVVLPNAPWKTIEELVADIKSAEKKMSYAVSGRGASGHIAGELFLSALDLGGKAIAVPYKGARQAGTKLLAGEVDFYVSGIADIRDFIDAGKMRVLGVFSDKSVEIGGKNPHSAPSLVEKWPGVEKCLPMNPIWGLHIARETPDDIVDRISEAFVHTVKTEEFKEFAKSRGLTIYPHLGLQGDKVASQVESAYSWGFQGLGMAKVSPESLGIPKPEEWSWPPHKKAEEAKAWPAKWVDWKPYILKP